MSISLVGASCPRGLSKETVRRGTLLDRDGQLRRHTPDCHRASRVVADTSCVHHDDVHNSVVTYFQRPRPLTRCLQCPAYDRHLIALGIEIPANRDPGVRVAIDLPGGLIHVACPRIYGVQRLSNWPETGDCEHPQVCLFAFDCPHGSADLRRECGTPGG